MEWHFTAEMNDFLLGLATLNPGIFRIARFRFSLWGPVTVFIILRFVARPLLDHSLVFTIAGEARNPITGTLSTVASLP